MTPPIVMEHIALDDLVSVEEDKGNLYFDELIEPSGNSVVQIVIFNENDVSKIGRQLENLGCTWEGSHIKNLISVDIPKELSYNVVKAYLDKSEQRGSLSYKEACLSHKY